MFAEPTIEEKLQKLHSEIKFALKVDNPVSKKPFSFVCGSTFSSKGLCLLDVPFVLLARQIRWGVFLYFPCFAQAK